VPLFATAGALCRRAPLAAGAVLVLAEFAQALLGVRTENPASTVAVLATAFCLGRYRSDLLGLVPLAALDLAMAGREGFAVPTLLFVTLLLGAVWTTGRLLRRRTERAEAAGAEAAALGRADPAAHVERLVADERARLAGEILDVVRTAVTAMQDEAARAARSLDPGACAAVQEHGRRAVAELRRLLGLLRSEQPRPQPEPTARPRRAAWPVDVLIAAAAATIVGIEWATVGAERPWTSAALSLGLCAALGLLRTDAAAACLAATVPVALALATGQPLLHGIETVVIVVLLAWAAGADGRRFAWVALAVWTLLMLIELQLGEPGNEPILLACVLVGAVPGYLWSARRGEERSALATADELRARQAELAERAVRAERLRLARELHDVASHAIGVMVLQAGAAEVQCPRDPAAARGSLDAVRTAGVQAQSELAVLFGLLDAGAVGAPGLASTAPAPELTDAVRTLVQRMRQGGLDVSLDTTGDLDGELAPAGTGYRVVQEALTNAARHAPRSRVAVRLVRDGDALTIEVSDDGPPSESAGGGFGLVGLAERVRAEGGEVAAGPRPEGGFGITARLPLRPAASA
jgi:signal transduction histidine kinase